jgi:hypothetical protein
VAASSIAVRLLSWLAVGVVVYEWFSLVFSQFPYTRPWGEGLTRFLLGIVSRLGTGVLQAMPDLIVAVAELAATVAARWGSRRGRQAGTFP